jgi:PAS domain S-box-containing protein
MESPLQILIIEDSEGDFLLIENYIKEGFESFKLVHVWRLSEAENAILQNRFDLIFLDLTLPDSFGKDSVLKILELAKHTPVIVLTGNSDLNFAIQSMQLGVQDYLNKDDISSTSIQKSIRYSIERNKIRLQLIDSDNRFRSIIEHSIDGFALINGDGVFQELSPYGNLIIGYDPLENAGHFRLDYLHPKDRRMVVATFLEAVKIPGSVKLLEFRYKQANDGYLWIESTFYNLLENPSVKAVVLNYREVTSRKEEEEKRKLLIQELTLTNNYLKQFGLIFSHNLRGPLTNLLSISDLLNNERVNEAQLKELHKAIRTSTFQLNDTLNDIIKVLLIREKRNTPLKKIALNDFLNAYIEKRKSIGDFLNCTIEIDLAKDNFIYFDKEFLDSILNNLFSNALKFASPERPLLIKIKSYKSRFNTVFEFSDNGIGFDIQMVKDRIFGLYQKFHDNIEGKGFGLYLIHSLVSSLGGSISCESSKDKGTNFKIIFKKQP